MRDKEILKKKKRSKWWKIVFGQKKEDGSEIWRREEIKMGSQRKEYRGGKIRYVVE